MPNPITIHHDERKINRSYGVPERPDGCTYPIRGIPWDTVVHPDYLLSVQQMDFLGNHLQLLEMQALHDVQISFTVDVPGIFVVIMIEGFVRFHRRDTLLSYAMGGVMYMTYNPRMDMKLTAGTGKHVLMAISLDRDWAMTARRSYPLLRGLLDSLYEERDEIKVMPMCRLAKPVADLWESMRIVRSDPFVHRAEMAVNTGKLLSFYHGQLEKGNVLKGQLDVGTTNELFRYVKENYLSERGMSAVQIVKKLGISIHKIEEYAQFLFGKSLHKHVRDLRMAKAAELLRETDIAVTAIGYRVGYSNSSHFFKIFTTYFDMPPSAYRQKHRSP